MAIVKTLRINGATVNICDDAYRDASPEELERRKKEVQRVAGEILTRMLLENPDAFKEAEDIPAEDLDAQKLYAIAEDFRQAILKTKKKELPVSLWKFPFGACGQTSLMLGHHLEATGCGIATYVTGSYRWIDQDGIENIGYHAWLELGGYAIDITGSQFDYIEDDVTVCPAEQHRARFESCEVKMYWKSYDGPVIEGRKHLKYDRLWKNYCSIIKHCAILPETETEDAPI